MESLKTKYLHYLKSTATLSQSSVGACLTSESILKIINNITKSNNREVIAPQETLVQSPLKNLTTFRPLKV